MLAFHGEQNLKDSLRARYEEANRTNRLCHGHYYNSLSDCGCLLGHALKGTVGYIESHRAFERVFGIPAWLARAMEMAFEWNHDAGFALAMRILDAIPVGADLECLRSDFGSYKKDLALSNSFDRPPCSFHTLLCSDGYFEKLIAALSRLSGQSVQPESETKLPERKPTPAFKLSHVRSAHRMGMESDFISRDLDRIPHVPVFN